MLKFWKATIKEIAGDPPVQQNANDLPVNLVIMGGLSSRQWPGNNFFSQNLQSQGQFLTWQPDRKLISKQQQEYLYFSTISRAWFSVYLHCKAYFADGTTETKTLKNQTFEADKILIVPVGYAQLELDTEFPDKEILKYTIWLNNSSDPESYDKRSEPRTYAVDQTEFYKQTTYFLYQNSLGAFETLRCTGNLEKIVSHGRQSGKRIIDFTYTQSTRQYFNYDIRSRETVKMNTGYLFRDWKSHLQEFYHSEGIYEIGSSFLPVVLNTEKLNLPDTRDNIHFDEFEYQYTIENRSYSNL
ncbi:MAG: hypothetical protein HC831_18730 [Chloroflexia bacterium]|nr:hypothetical protein [Chloroflexia bacterium]